MSQRTTPRPSYSAASRWRIGIDLVVRTILVFAVAGMVNYLGARYFHRFYLSGQTRMELSPHTLTVLRALTNRVQITLYYDTRDADNNYATVAALLDEYRSHNPKITVRSVDYNRDPGQAVQVKEQYKAFFGGQADKDQIIFDAGGGRVKVFPGAALMHYEDKYSGMESRPENPSQKVMGFTRVPVEFNGEQAFTSILLSLTRSEPLKAYYLQGHGEPSLTDPGVEGYQSFAGVLAQNDIRTTPLDLLGAVGVPEDCNLLIIAGPQTPLRPQELQEIDHYLHEGGRLLAMFNFRSVGHPTGLEAILQKWDIGVVDDLAQDPGHTITTRDIVVETFGKHAVVDSLAQVRLQLYLPHPILKLPAGSAAADAPQVDELFATSAGGTLAGNPNEPPHNYPLACAVEEKPVAGVSHPRGNTRIIVVGDDMFLGNYYINADGNRDFLNSAVNWLCARDKLVAGIGPRPVTNFRLQITRHQQRQLAWLLLGGLPGAVLLLGGLVWFVRRK